MRLLFELLCLYLVASGSLLLLIYYRTKYDVLFAYAGWAMLSLTVFAAIDIWAFAGNPPLTTSLYWSRIQHVFAAGIIVLLIQYLSALCSYNSRWLRVSSIAVSTMFAVLFTTPAMLVVSGDKVVARVAYNVLFVPYTLLVAGVVLFLLVRGLTRLRGELRRIVFMHALGFSLLLLFGLGDVLVSALFGQGQLKIPSFTILGVLAFGVTISLVFSERFLMLIKDRDSAYHKLHEAYAELEQAAAVRQLGESAAMIGHELNNDLSIIRMPIDYVVNKSHLNADDRAKLNMSLDRIDKTVQFSRDILDLVKSRVLREKQQVNLTGLIERVIENRFAAKLQSFVWESPKIPMTIHGDWGKLEQLFHNLFKNSFEAGAQNIRIRHRVGNGVLALTLEDDGLGVDAPEKLAKFFKAFFTTKDGKFGSGLGLSICRAIIESHGGAVSAYSRNLSDGDGHGVRFMLTFPLYDTQEQKAGTPTGVVVLVKDGIDDIEGVLRVLRNVHVTPRVCAQVGEVGAAAGDRHLRMVLMAANRTGRIIEGGGGQWGSVVLLATDKQTIYAMNTIPSGRPQLFTEEYVISTIVA